MSASKVVSSRDSTIVSGVAVPAARATLDANRPTRRNALFGSALRGSARFGAALCAAALAMVASSALAIDDPLHKYRSLAPGMHWTGNTLSWYYAPSGQPAWASDASVVTLISQAMNAWSAQCGVQFSYLGTTPQQATVQDGASIIGWVPTLAYAANTSWYMRDGAITEADIQFNVNANGSGAALYPMILHEVGHAIGLDHSEVASSVMAGPPTSQAYSYATSLTADDVAGCQALYGPSQSKPVASQQASATCTKSPAPVTRTIACAPGMTGQIVEEESYACRAGTWASAGWRVLQNSCTPNSTVVAADALAIEYYHPALDHYFMTANPAEQATLAKGGPDGMWQPTGASFPVWKLAYPTLQAMCRFYGDSTIDPATGKRKGPDSHFYTADSAECSTVQQRWPQWMFEGYTFFAARPDGTGSCPAGTQPVYRYFRPQGDPNHRYVSSEAGKQTMAGRGWIAEGVAWCAGA